jgi:hypothetical protein
MIDLNTNKVVIKSKMRGFYPWNIQYIHERNVYAGMYFTFIYIIEWNARDCS